MKWAETWLDVGRLPLRRRDRAAMVLALEYLRAGHANSAAEYSLDILAWGSGTTVEVRAAARHALWSAADGISPRLLRARLALLLRVLLRVDAGNLPWWRCPEHGRRVTFDWSETKNREEWWCPSCRKWFVTEMYPPTRAVRPLWEAAR